MGFARYLLSVSLEYCQPFCIFERVNSEQSHFKKRWFNLLEIDRDVEIWTMAIELTMNSTHIMVLVVSLMIECEACG
jgi:hypothetical protein